MARCLFNDEERSVLENLDLLAAASRRFIEGGLADRLVPAFLACVRRYADELSLREVTVTDESDEQDREEEHEAEQFAEGSIEGAEQEAQDKSRLNWPNLSESIAWAGISSKPLAASPELFINVDLLYQADHGVTLDFSAYRRERRDWRAAEKEMNQFGFTPEPTRWQEWDPRVEDRQRKSYRTEWKFKLTDNAVAELAVNCSLLLLERSPSLKDVSPEFARLLLEYQQICEYFSKVTGLRRISSTARSYSASATSPTYSKVKERDLRILSVHAGGLLRAKSLYENESDGVGSRAGTWVGESIDRLCQENDLVAMQVRYPPRPLGSTWDASYESFWSIGNEQIVLQLVVRMPDALNDSDIQLDAVVYLNWLCRLKKLERKQALWNASDAALIFDRRDWTRTRSKASHTFWGYVAADGKLTINISKLVVGDRDAVRTVQSAVDAVKKASDMVAKCKKSGDW